MRKEGEERLHSLGNMYVAVGSGLTKMKKNIGKKKAAMLRNKEEFTGKRVGCNSHSACSLKYPRLQFIPGLGNRCFSFSNSLIYLQKFHTEMSAF